MPKAESVKRPKQLVRFCTNVVLEERNQIKRRLVPLCLIQHIFITSPSTIDNFAKKRISLGLWLVRSGIGTLSLLEIFNIVYSAGN